MANSEHTKIGKAFQERVCKALEDLYNEVFLYEESIPIGNPVKGHFFDLSNKNHSIVVECKCYTWTESGNVPSAKLMGLDEAVFYFSFLPANTKKILCMAKSVHKNKTETLAEYYVRIHGHLLSNVSVFEIDENGNIKVIR